MPRAGGGEATSSTAGASAAAALVQVREIALAVASMAEQQLALLEDWRQAAVRGGKQS
jgi:hypothetical protein